MKIPYLGTGYNAVSSENFTPASVDNVFCTTLKQLPVRQAFLLKKSSFSSPRIILTNKSQRSATKHACPASLLKDSFWETLDSYTECAFSLLRAYARLHAVEGKRSEK